jgi:predicted DCC family thiol-disulfide oxidoreductase YuxK
VKPLLVYDGDCGFCRAWIRRWRVLTGDRVDDAPYQDAADRFPDIPIEEFRRAVQFIDVDGRVYSGAEAIFRSLAVRPSRAWPLWLYRHVPGFGPLSEGLYRLVAANRSFLSRLSRRS